MKTRGLKTKLVVLAIVLGCALTSTLLMLQWAQHREASSKATSQGERALFVTERARLASEAADIAAKHA
ncbi:MAG: hypothetical protein ABW034_25970, partial [Steroidobacteraceae bacterium]